MRWDPVQEQPLSWKACSASWAESLHSIVIITIVIIIIIITIVIIIIVITIGITIVIIIVIIIIEDDLNADSSLPSVLELKEAPNEISHILNHKRIKENFTRCFKSHSSRWTI